MVISMTSLTLSYIHGHLHDLTNTELQRQFSVTEDDTSVKSIVSSGDTVTQ